MNEYRPSRITKVLSRNDSGETGGHQAGILVPKDPDILSFFPALHNLSKNPRQFMYFKDTFGEMWKLCFIYYNNKFFGGTRNEYRLTHMTPFFRNYSLKAGDSITLERLSDGSYTISHKYSKKTDKQWKEGDVLKLGTKWKVIRI